MPGLLTSSEPMTAPEVEIINLELHAHLAIDTNASVRLIKLDGQTFLVAAAKSRIVLIDPRSGRWVEIAGLGSNPSDGWGNQVSIRGAGAFAVLDDAIYFVDCSQSIRQLTLQEGLPPFESSSWLLKTIAGSGQKGWQDGSGADARFTSVAYMATNEKDTIYVSDSHPSNRVRAIKVKDDGELPLRGADEMASLEKTGAASIDENDVVEFVFKVDKAVLSFRHDVRAK